MIKEKMGRRKSRYKLKIQKYVSTKSNRDMGFT